MNNIRPTCTVRSLGTSHSVRRTWAAGSKGRCFKGNSAKNSCAGGSLELKLSARKTRTLATRNGSDCARRTLVRSKMCACEETFLATTHSISLVEIFLFIGRL